jgi:hypothetical protein
MAVISFMIQAHGPNAIKLLIPIFILWYVRVFVPSTPFPPNIMFAGKAGVYLNEGPSRCSALEQAPGLNHKH